TGWVFVQVLLLGVAFFLPVYMGQGFGQSPVIGALAFGLVVLGLGLVLLGALHLGGSLKPFPMPKPNATLQVAGLYRFVRHPIYAGAVLAVLGWSLWWHSWPGVLWTLLVFAFFDRKAAYEERWLVARFPEYRHYRQRTAKFFPFVY
ncbi:MAG: methyltransferase family protein, partial [Thermoanaerobaculum sp.]